VAALAAPLVPLDGDDLVPLIFSLKSSMNCGFLIEIANPQTKAVWVNITVPPKQ
jgi:hypothetical protein